MGKKRSNITFAHLRHKSSKHGNRVLRFSLGPRVANSPFNRLGLNPGEIVHKVHMVHKEVSYARYNTCNRHPVILCYQEQSLNLQDKDDTVQYKKKTTDESRQRRGDRQRRGPNRRLEFSVRSYSSLANSLVRPLSG